MQAALTWSCSEICQSYASGYAIYGVWFFPEEDREKILNLLHRYAWEPSHALLCILDIVSAYAASFCLRLAFCCRCSVIHSLKDVPAAIPNTPTNGSVNGKQTQPKAQQQPKKVEQQVQEQQPAPQVQQQPRARSRSRNKRDDSNGRRQSGGATNAAQPTMILQRSPKNGSKAGLPPTGAAPAQHAPKQEAAEAASGMVPISREDGIAAGEAILGMISQNRTTTVTTTTTTLTTPPPQQQAPASKGRNQRKKQQQQQTDLLLPTTVSASSASFVSGSPTHAATSSTATPVNKEQLKQTLISLLDDAHFFDQIYHAYVNRVHK